MFSKLKNMTRSLDLAEEKALRPVSEGVLDSVSGGFQFCWMLMPVGDGHEIILHPGYPPSV